MITLSMELGGEEFADLLHHSPDDLMECLASLAALGDASSLVEGYSGSLHHQRIPGFLRELADRIEERENDT